jgi:glyoxylase-like metal-dependent hydrolase (beta-lactamase superfamily II)/8-oxo-dGTP pyrophosphatase MutT (NUDIX family)
MKPPCEPASPAPPAVPRRAATLVVVRDGDAGMEVLLLRRVERSGDRSSGAFVFPGGTLDAADGRWHGQCAGLDDAQASRRLGVESGGLDYYVAAIRECFEEAGVLLACDAADEPAALDAQGAAAVDALRAQLRRGEIGLGELCQRLSLRLAADRLAYHSHWLTPPGLPKRFDTRFFVARMPPGQTAALHSEETLEHCWMRPSQALERAAGMRLPNPTRRTLQAIAGFATADDCVAHAQALREIRRVMPRVADGPQGLRPVHPDEPAYAEIGRLDPHGAGHARYAIEPGRAVRLSPRVWRITAPNPGVMTGPGTNSYLVGGDAAWAVIDPGPDDAAHVQAIVAAAPGPIRHILVTHTHRDHSPAARRLQALTGAELLGLAAPRGAGQDEGFVPDRTLRHGELLALGPDATLRVVHTPGHASNHLCYLLLEEKTLFTGDHVMQGSTVVINPPDGDMAAYLDSLQSLQGEDLDWLAPGHGFLMAEPRRRIEALLRHRRAREAKVLEALRALRPASLGDLLARVYDDVPERMHPVAERSLLAHLLQLAAEGRAFEREGRWSAAV